MDEYFVVIRSKPDGFRVSKMLRIILDRSYKSVELAGLALDIATKMSIDKFVVFGINCQSELNF